MILIPWSARFWWIPGWGSASLNSCLHVGDKRVSTHYVIVMISRRLMLTFFFPSLHILFAENLN